MKAVLFLLAASLCAETRTVELPGKSPLVTIRIVFLSGSAADPAGKAGLANLTAEMLTQGGTRQMTYPEIVEAMFPMSTSVSAEVDKEMTTFSGQTHIDNLEAYYKIFRSMILDPGWREDDLRRLKDAAQNYLRVTLRGNNDEELGKEVLYNALYEGTPYGHESNGAAGDIASITMEDLRRFHARRYTRANLIIGLAGSYPPGFAARVRKDFEALAASGDAPPPPSKPQLLARNRAMLIEKDTRSVAYSFGFPLDVTRRDPDYPALLLASTYLGHHRTSGGRLFQRMRQLRGLNYGDYSYIEYFPRGMFQFEPPPNLARPTQIFQIWIRPVEPPTANFALRLALFELDKLVREGIPAADFESTRQFLSKYVNVLTKTKRAELGYAIDSLYYGIPDYNSYIKQALARLTRDQVNQAIRRHLRSERLEIVAVTRNAADLKQQLLAEAAPAMTYNSPKPADVIAEDEIVRKFPLALRAEDIAVVPVARIFE
jgi:zinc protease